ncbi:MAG: hypothetical protein WCR33_02440 [Bacilli bacterium]
MKIEDSCMKYLSFLLLLCISGHAETCQMDSSTATPETICSARGYVYNLTYKPSPVSFEFQLTSDKADTSLIYTSISGSARPLWIAAEQSSDALMIITLTLSAKNNDTPVTVVYRKDTLDTNAVVPVTIKLSPSN